MPRPICRFRPPAIRSGCSPSRPRVAGRGAFLPSFQPGRPIPLLGCARDAFDLTRDHAAPLLAGVASRQNRALVLVSLSEGAVLGQTDAGVEPSLLRFRSDGRQLIAGSAADRNLSVFDVPSLRTVVRLPLPMAPRHFCFKRDGGQLFISGDGVDAVAIVYPFRTEVAETMLAGRAPSAMQTTEDPALLMVANPETGSITVLDFRTTRARNWWPSCKWGRSRAASWSRRISNTPWCSTASPGIWR